MIYDYSPEAVMSILFHKRKLVETQTHTKDNEKLPLKNGYEFKRQKLDVSIETTVPGPGLLKYSSSIFMLRLIYKTLLLFEYSARVAQNNSKCIIEQIMNHTKVFMQRITDARKDIKGMLTRYQSNRIASRLQRWWRRQVQPFLFIVNKLDDDEKLDKSMFIRSRRNVICPLTQDRIPRTDFYRMVLEDGKCVIYTLSELARYLVETTKFSCPLTRAPINICMLRRMKHKLKDESMFAKLIRVYLNKEEIHYQERRRADDIFSNELICSHILEDMVDIVDDDDIGVTAGLDHITEIIGEYIEANDRFWTLYPEECKSILKMEIGKLVSRGTILRDKIDKYRVENLELETKFVNTCRDDKEARLKYMEQIDANQDKIDKCELKIDKTSMLEWFIKDVYTELNKRRAPRVLSITDTRRLLAPPPLRITNASQTSNLSSSSSMDEDSEEE